MLGERIAELRKNKGISQEELGDILSTSRQAISKWERGESDPDIGRLKDLAVYFNVSIDYLLGYDIETTSVNSFIERANKCCEESTYDISIDEIRMILSRNTNNLNLLLAAIDYIGDYYYLKREEGLLDLLIKYVKKAILLFQPNNIFNTDLNSLHHMIASVYALKGEFELSKEYIKDNQVIKSEELMAQCEFVLGHYEEVEKLTSGIFLSSIGALIDSNAVQIRVFMRTNRFREALDLSDWSINLTKSVGKNEEDFLSIVYIFSFIKACCEKILGLDYSNSLKFLKDNRDRIIDFKNINDGLKFYNNKRVVFASESGDIKADLYKEIQELKKNNINGYQDGFDIFNELYGE